ncbi:MAG: UDP-N-acetylglucosamine 2-epimerase [Candidatus Kapaibacterium sp.]|nr:MAG: UDP-N-acetylglucosamine 2-epimerase [Candidatus Kapabacteria bacterium]
MKKKKILFIFGTRPEGIKLATLIKKFKEDKDFEAITCITSQHREMLMQVVEYFNLPIDFDLQVMIENQTLDYITSRTVEKLEGVFAKVKPDLVIVQGDATTSFIGALSSFYHKVPVAHIEAGLRTFDKNFPYPEELNRCLITQISDLHFAPTKNAVNNLKLEHIPDERIFLVGNTTIDAQLHTIGYVENNIEIFKDKFKFIDFNKKVILVTCHRRENFGQPFIEICNALSEIAQKFKEIEIVFPVHLNPNIRQIAFTILKAPNIFLLDPLDYPSMLYLMKNSYLIVSDSGGIQEEAPTFGKPVIVLREKTERIESIKLGISVIVGANKDKIIHWIEQLLTDSEQYSKMSKICFPYGDGTASEKIYQNIKEYFI